MNRLGVLNALMLVLSGMTVLAQNPSEALTAELQAHYEKSSLPGFAVSLVSESGVLFQQGFGYADVKSEKPYTTSTIQNIGSVTKTVVGLALVKAIEEGHLTMDTEINDVLPFEIKNPSYPDDPILVRHLANHTSTILNTKFYGNTYVRADIKEEREGIHEDFYGFLGTHMDISANLFLRQILEKGGKWYKKKNFSKDRPGEAKEYSNLNAALVAYLIEISSGIPFQAYTKERILDPLKMNSSGWSLGEIDLSRHATLYFPAKAIVPWYRLITYSDGGLITSVDDLNNYLMEMIRAYSGESSFLAPKYAKIMLPGDEDENRAFWGMGQTSRNIGHGGSDPGVQTDMQFNADSKIGRIIFCNVNAEDNEELDKQYNEIHAIVRKYEAQFQ